MNRWEILRYELYGMWVQFIRVFFNEPQKTKRKRKAKRKELSWYIANPTPSICNKKSIVSAQCGESGYIVGWALHFDMESQSWYINGSYFLSCERGGTAGIKVYVNHFCNIEVHGIAAFAEYLSRYIVNLAADECHDSYLAQRSTYTNFDNGDLIPIVNSDEINRWIASFGGYELNNQLFDGNQS